MTTLACAELECTDLSERLTPSGPSPRICFANFAYQENVLGSFSKLQLLGRACASDLSEHTQVRGAFHSVSR